MAGRSVSPRGTNKGAAVERGQEFPDRLRVCTQEPCRLGNHGPTSQQRTPDVVKLLDTRFMVFVGFQEDGHHRARIHQHLAGQEPPNPSKYFGFVLRSRIVPFTAPINPAFFACSYAVSEPSSAASFSSTAVRTTSDSRVPPRRAAALSRRRISGENRTVMRWSFIYARLTFYQICPTSMCPEVVIWRKRRIRAIGQASGSGRCWVVRWPRLNLNGACCARGAESLAERTRLAKLRRRRQAPGRAAVRIHPSG
jgi:hypothetical protein